ncbi:MAG TPA: cobyric acid synthase [Trebonia sp.]|nr:cobyric acid synthase [Trebonia sp.]
MNALLVAGTASDAGKSVITAGLCRWLARQGLRVAPFKAQNMSLNSFVTADGCEIGRAQAMQAAAAGIEPEGAMNPVLLKPGGHGSSQVMLLGEPVAEAGALSYADLRPRLRPAVLDCLAGLRQRFDVVVCEGAGSPAEINLRAGDLANMGLARAARLPVIVAGDIDRGGVLAAMYGTLALLSAEDQALVAGFVVNKFRGDARLLAPGLEMLARLTGRPVLGVLPLIGGLWLDAEDSLGLGARPAPGAAAGGAAAGGAAGQAAGAGDILRVAVVRLPRISNFTDVDPLAAEPSVLVSYAATAGEIAAADLVILPGSRSTVADLGWLRRTGLAGAITARARAGRPVLGICAGYQMLAGQIHDDVESRAGTVTGLGLLPATVRFQPGKVLRRCQGEAFGERVSGYQIHHGVTEPDGGEPFPGGCRAGAVWGTSWHGLFESDGFRQAFLSRVAAAAGRAYTPAGVSFRAERERQLDALGDLIAAHLDTAALLRLIEGGAPAGLPFIPPGAP